MTKIATSTAPAALKQLFDQQLVKAVELSGDEAGLKALFPLLEKIGKTQEGEGRIPLVIIAQNRELTLAKRMAKVTLDGKTGTSYLADSLVANLDNIPPGHYLMVDVEDGRAMTNTKPSVCLARFKRANRFGCTTVEGVTVAFYDPKILRHHYFDLPGSRCDGGVFPCLGVYGGGPGLFAGGGDLADPGCGSLSCGSRLGLEVSAA